MCPASEQYCPILAHETNIHIRESNKFVEREHIWDFETPTLDAKNYFCKYHIQVDDALISGDADADKGLIYLEGEQYGFDEEVFVYVQPKGQWENFSSTNKVNDITTIYRAFFGRKFLIPAEYDVMVSFAPIRWS